MSHGSINNIFELVSRGGLMMVPMLILALLALTVILERTYLLMKVYVVKKSWLEQFFASVNGGDFSNAEKLCRDQQQTPLAQVFLKGLAVSDRGSAQEFELALKNEAEKIAVAVERRLPLLDFTITASPLMGLLGTITGMIGSFQILSEKGVNEPQAITGGVAEALIATATGLLLALFSLTAYNYLTARSQNFIFQMESAISQWMELRFKLNRPQV